MAKLNTFNIFTGINESKRVFVVFLILKDKLK